MVQNMPFNAEKPIYCRKLMTWIWECQFWQQSEPTQVPCSSSKVHNSDVTSRIPPFPCPSSQAQGSLSTGRSLWFRHGRTVASIPLSLGETWLWWFVIKLRKRRPVFTARRLFKSGFTSRVGNHCCFFPWAFRNNQQYVERPRRRE